MLACSSFQLDRLNPDLSILTECFCKAIGITPTSIVALEGCLVQIELGFRSIKYLMQQFEQFIITTKDRYFSS